MSIITLQIGQCGNQMGYEFFSTLCEEYGLNEKKSLNFNSQDVNSECLDIFFDEIDSKRGNKYTARSVLVDTEVKVVEKIYAQACASWKYHSKCKVIGKKGSGSNWALATRQAEEAMSQVEEALIRQSEKCDRLSGVMVMGNIGGGTGSGFGSVMSSLIKDIFPHSSLLNQMTWPQSEVAVSDYNSILSLSNILPHTDCLLNHYNHQLQFNNVTFEDINNHICKDLMFILSPSSPHSSSSSSPYSPLSSSPPPRLTSTDSLSHLINHMCSHPDFKFCHVGSGEQSASHNAFNFNSILRQLKRNLNNTNCTSKRPLGQNDNIPKGVQSHLLMLRGKNLQDMNQEVLKCINGKNNQFSPHSFSCLSNPRKIFKEQKTALLLTNRHDQMKCLDSLVQRAWKMFSCRAYVHQYERYGLEESDFLESFAHLEQVLSNYANL